MRWNYLALFVLVGCSSAPPKPTSCQTSDQTGTYLEHWTTVSGNCGDIPDALVQFSNGQTVSAQNGMTSCMTVAISMSMGGCRTDQTIDCTSGALAGGSITEFVEEDATGGAHFSGELTVTGPCVGTYKIALARQ